MSFEINSNVANCSSIVFTIFVINPSSKYGRCTLSFFRVVCDNHSTLCIVLVYAHSYRIISTLDSEHLINFILQRYNTHPDLQLTLYPVRQAYHTPERAGIFLFFLTRFRLTNQLHNPKYFSCNRM